MQRRKEVLPVIISFFQANALLGFLKCEDLTIPAGEIKSSEFTMHIMRSRSLAYWRNTAVDLGMCKEEVDNYSERSRLFECILRKAADALFTDRNYQGVSL